MSAAKRKTGRSESHRLQCPDHCQALSWKLVAFIIGFTIWLANCSEAGKDASSSAAAVEPERNVAQLTLPPELASAEQKYVTYCSRCHGIQGRGTDHGPPLVHKIYEPRHHSDFAFQRAAANGVRAHHWKFGNMPPIEGVTAQDVAAITRYIRWLQRQAGIF